VTREQIIEIHRRGVAGVVALAQRLLDTIARLEQENDALQAKVASLEKDSTNSSKPPSSDGLKKKRGAPTRGSSGRKPGGQKGHPGKTRTPAPRADVSETIAHRPRACDHCGQGFADDAEGRVVERRQVWDIPPIKPTVTEHLFLKLICLCGHETRLPAPDWIRSGVGENLQAMIAYLTSVAKLSRRAVQNVLAQVFHVRLALGTVQNRLEDTSDALAATCEELEEALVQEPVLNVDETGYPHNRRLDWLWAFVTPTFVFFAIRASRGSKVLKEVLGERFDGIIICDRFSAYIKYHKDRACGLVQYCWAHILRQAKGLPEALGCGSGQLFSRLVRQRVGALFRVWHAFKQGRMSQADLIAKAEVHMGLLKELLERNAESASKPVRAFCQGQLDKWASLFTFVYHEGVEPTNNLAERTIRPGVQTRKISYCTRSAAGQVLRARLLTVSQTCRLQDRNPLEFLVAAIRAKREGLPVPSLLPHDAQHEEPIAA
jgi:transposase